MVSSGDSLLASRRVGLGGRRIFTRYFLLKSSCANQATKTASCGKLHGEKLAVVARAVPPAAPATAADAPAAGMPTMR